MHARCTFQSNNISCQISHSQFANTSNIIFVSVFSSLFVGTGNRHNEKICVPIFSLKGQKLHVDDG